jgi:FtsH-binding integral membrane protein
MYNYSSSGYASTPYTAGLDFSAIMRRVYLWLMLGLAVSFGVSYVLGKTILAQLNAAGGDVTQVPLLNPVVSIVALVAYFAIGFTFYPVVRRASPAVGAAIYVVFTAVFGFMISTIWLTYKQGTIAQAFAVTAAMFGAMSIIGFATKLDLSKLGSILFMALIGVIIASVVNFFVHSEALYWALTYLIVIIFCGLTAYDTQWIRKNALSIASTGDGQAAGRIALIGAFKLFLDFINLFLALLRIFGRSR